MRLDGKVREEMENGMFSPVSKETPMECHGLVSENKMGRSSSKEFRGK